MKKIITTAIMLVLLAACDERPPGSYDSGQYKYPIEVRRVEVNGITYVNFSRKFSERDEGWAVDFSQFFVEDTLIVNGQVWIRVGSEQEAIKQQRVPDKKTDDG